MIAPLSLLRGRLSRGLFGSSRSASPSPHLRILVVDDEEPIRRFVSRVLAAEGFDTSLAASGAEALEIASTQSFDLLLTDLMMPGMSGDELARRLRAREPDLRVLYFTGFSDRLFAERLTLWDNEAFLDKPCSRKGLLQAVSLATSGHTEPAELSA